MTLSADLNFLGDWMRQHTPRAHAALLPPLAPEELAALGEQLTRAGHPQPEEVLTLYRWRGGSGPTSTLFGLEWGPPGMPTPGIEEDMPYATSHPPGHVRETFMPPGHWVFLHDGSGDGVALDLTPGPLGRAGQVITAGARESHRFVLAAGLGEFVHEYVQRLRAGTCAIFPPEGSQDTEQVCLLNGQGDPVQDYFALADLFPGFGAAPIVAEQLD